MIDNLTAAIAHYKERARNYIETLKPFGDKPMLESTKKYIARQQEFARKYEQLASWLTELQERREADKWISVKERLPEQANQSYLVTVDYGNGIVGACQRFFFGEDIGWNDDCVIAWKPLPKPYESEATNETDTHTGGRK